LRLALVLILLFDLLITNRVDAQPENVKHRPEPELSLRLQPENLARGVPRAFKFILTNIGKRDLRLPLPYIDCSNVSWRGSLWLNESWQASTGAAALAVGQSSCDFGSRFIGRPEPTLIRRRPEPSLIQRVKSWALLRPGESIYITTSAANPHSEGAKPGLYEFSGIYIPPLLTNQQLQLLTNAKIYVPQQKIKSEGIQYLKPSY
jgi:hypothetical protein